MLTGSNFIGSRESRVAPGGFRAQDPSTGEALEPAFAEATPADVDAAGQAAQAAFEECAALPPARRAAFLRAIAEQLARLDRAQPDRKPLPKPDLRRMLVPLGPVAVFGASNFPLAFSVAGGDTVSALAAGCPVVVKAHPAHPGTSELAAALPEELQGPNPRGIWRLVDGRPTREAL